MGLIMRVLLTGSASHLARVLLPRLCAVPWVEAVVGCDVRPTPFRHAKFIAHRLDIREAGFEGLIAGCDALVHLAFVVLRGRLDAPSMRAVNVEGTRRVFTLAAERGVQRLVHLSSAAVYGGGENLTEAAPLAPLPGFLYAHHKAEVEAWLAATLPQVVRLRPHAILGPHCQPLLATLLRLPLGVKVSGPAPRLQCVHEEDVADAILAALERPVAGPFNLAAPGSFTLDALPGRRLPLPFFLARGLLSTAWRLTGFGGEPGWLAGLRHSLTLDCSRAHTGLGWQPRHDVTAILGAMIPP
jgi:UDP-glucose 4-epimerase